MNTTATTLRERPLPQLAAAVAIMAGNGHERAPTGPSAGYGAPAPTPGPSPDSEPPTGR